MSAPPIAYIALGSNLGDSAALIRGAWGNLQKLSDKPVRHSSLWQSEPVDCPPGSPPFVNAVAAIEPRSHETPLSLLRRLRQIEEEAGRRPKKIQNEPRLLDLDLIAFGDVTVNEARLTLPHPRSHMRAFVLQPLAELAPDLILPGQSRTVRQLAADLGESQLVRKI